MILRFFSFFEKNPEQFALAMLKTAIRKKPHSTSFTIT